MRVTMLGGGIGCSRLALPLARRLGTDLTLVVNTGDDLWRYGLRICPDLDTNMYALAGLQDRERGWGVAGDSFRAMEQLHTLGDDPWFNLGDLDLAMHLRRTEALRAGAPLTAVTAEITRALDVAATILPMTDDEVGTRITTPTGEHSFEEYFVRDAALEEVLAVRYRGIGTATATPQVHRALATADLVVIGPSNPMSSIRPILSLPTVRECIRRRPCVAVSPIVSGVEIVDPGEQRRARSRAAQLRSEGLSHFPVSAAWLYRDIIDGFVMDTADRAQADEIPGLGPAVLLADTIVDSDARADALAEAVLGFGADIAYRHPVTEGSRA